MRETEIVFIVSTSTDWNADSYELFVGEWEYVETALLTLWHHDVMPRDASNTQVVRRTRHFKHHIWASCKNNYDSLFTENNTVHSSVYTYGKKTF